MGLRMDCGRYVAGVFGEPLRVKKAQSGRWRLSVGAFGVWMCIWF